MISARVELLSGGWPMLTRIRFTSACCCAVDMDAETAATGAGAGPSVDSADPGARMRSMRRGGSAAPRGCDGDRRAAFAAAPSSAAVSAHPVEVVFKDPVVVPLTLLRAVRSRAVMSAAELAARPRRGRKAAVTGPERQGPDAEWAPNWPRFMPVRDSTADISLSEVCGELRSAAASAAEGLPTAAEAIVCCLIISMACRST